MKNNQSNILEKAKAYSFLLLKFRMRSEKELCQRLKKKKFPEAVIKDTLLYLKDRRFLDDANFTKAWIESRLKKPYGLNRIKRELILKGIDNDIIDTQLESLRKDYREEEIVVKIAREKFNRLDGGEPQKTKRRIYAYLLSRGFSPEIVNDALNQL